jgi:dolichyl-phosphate beta-glucosyltransferase
MLRSLSIIVPAFNEESRLPESLTKLLTWIKSAGLEFVEILVVDDGSTDGTAALVERMSASIPAIRLLRNGENRGKGYSVKNGMAHLNGEWALVTDADLSAPIEEISKLYEAAIRTKSQIAIGSRALNRKLIGQRQPLGREYAGRVFNSVMRFVTGLPFRDTQCGFKLFHSTAAARIFPLQQLDGFGFDVEDLYIARVLGIPVVEVPVRWNNVEGTRVSLWNGIRSFGDPIKIRILHLSGKYRHNKSTSPAPSQG